MNNDFDPLSGARGIVNGIMISLVLWAILALTLCSAAQAESRVVLTPPKIILEPGQVSGRWMLVNKGTSPAKYIIEPTALMDHETHRTDVCQHILFAPKAVTIEPGERQVIRFLVKGAPAGPGGCRMKFAAQPMPVEPKVGEEPRVGVSFLIGFTAAIYTGGGE